MKPSINLRYKSLLLTCLLILSVSAVAPAQITKIEYINGYKHPDTGYGAIYMTFKDGRQNCLLPSEQIYWHLGKEDNPIIILME